MSWKSHKNLQRLIAIDQLHQLLRTECRCTEEEIHILYELLQGRAPIADVEHMMAIHEGRVPPRMRGTLHVDMGDGEIMSIRPTNHPQIQLLDYLTETYGKRFGTLYWIAFGERSPRKLFHTFSQMCKAPMFADILAEDEGPVDGGYEKDGGEA
jgi:hypothetical protein